MTTDVCTFNVAGSFKIPYFLWNWISNIVYAITISGIKKINKKFRFPILQISQINSTSHILLVVEMVDGVLPICKRLKYLQVVL